MYCHISCWNFARCNVFVLHSSHVALFACCNDVLLHFVHVLLFPEVYPGLPQASKVENFATIIDKMFNIVAKLSILDVFGCSCYASYVFHVARFLFCNLAWTKGGKHNQKKTLHSAPSTCFLFILISYNTSSSLYSFEWLVKWKRNQFTLFLEKIMLAKAWKFENQDAN